MSKVRAVLLDLGGVVFVGDEAVRGSVEAVGRLRDAGLGVRFLTNTSRSPLRAVAEKLTRLGLRVERDEIFTPAVAARRTLAGRRPHLLVHPDLREDFAGLDSGSDVVVVGDAGEAFTYAAMNAAFRALDSGADLLALAKNRDFRDADGGRSLDAGPFVAALEYAGGRTAEVVGKPSSAFFRSALDSLGVDAGVAVMIGDDAASDVGGALAAGLAGILVRTGKCAEGHEADLDAPPTAVADDLAAAVAEILRG